MAKEEVAGENGLFANQEDLAQLTSAMTAAIRGGASLSWSQGQLHALQQHAEQYAGQFASWNQADWSQSGLPKAYLAAGTVYSTTHDLALVLDGLNCRSQVRRDLERAAFRSLTYLAVIFAIGAFLLYGYNECISPTFYQSHRKLTLQPAARTALATWPSLSQLLLVPFGIGFSLVASILIFRKSHWIAWCLGGAGYSTYREITMVLHLVKRLTQGSLSASEAKRLAVELVDARMPAVSAINKLTRFSKDENVEAAQQDANMRFYLGAAVNRLYAVQVMIPILLVAALGGLAAFSYGIAIYSPLIVLLKEYASANGPTWR